VEGVIAQPCDISDEAQVAALMDTIERESGRLDILVNNAANQGLGHGGPLEMKPSDFREVFAVNVIGGFQVTQAACNRFFMKQESRGSVVFLSSNTARRAIRRRTAYCASKGAVNSMVRALALDLAPLGIRVNCCAPGYINTERWDTLEPAKAARRRLNCPLRHEAQGGDIANVVAFLASDDAGNMTGEIVTCDAGCSCQHMPEDVDV
jgi:NAD(P)-dependent dehydrogenase (short-subunit alcohol dehydrogenase family)